MACLTFVTLPAPHSSSGLPAEAHLFIQAPLLHPAVWTPPAGSPTAVSYSACPQLKLNLQRPRSARSPAFWGTHCSSLGPRPTRPAVRLGALPAAHPAHSSPEGRSLSPSTRRGRSTDSREVNPAFPGGNVLGRVCRAPGPHVPPQGPVPSSRWAIQLASALPGEHVCPAHGPASTTLKHHGLLRGPPCPLPSRTVGSSSWC